MEMIITNKKNKIMETKDLIKNYLADGFLFAFSGDDTSLEDVLENDQVTKTYEEAVIAVIQDMDGWEDVSRYENLSDDEKIKSYHKASNSLGSWEASHTWIYNLEDILNA